MRQEGKNYRCLLLSATTAVKFLHLERNGITTNLHSTSVDQETKDTINLCPKGSMINPDSKSTTWTRGYFGLRQKKCKSLTIMAMLGEVGIVTLHGRANKY